MSKHTEDKDVTKRWERMRTEWLRRRPNYEQTTEVRAKSIDVEEVVESIFSQNGDGRLPQPIPLSQMVDILIDFWEADGFYE